MLHAHHDKGRDGDAVKRSTIIGAALAAAGAAWLHERNAGAAVSLPEQVPTIYGSPDGLGVQMDRSLEFLAPLQPGGVQIHTGLEDIRDHASARVQRVRAVLPGAEVWFGTTGDEHFTDVQNGRMSVATLQRIRIDAAKAAAAAGARVLMHDCEAMWKRNAPGFRAGDAAEMIASIRAEAPSIMQGLTCYYAPTLHADFPWSGFTGVQIYSPQIYYDAGGGPSAWVRFRDSWATAIRLGWINPNAWLAAYLRPMASKGTMIETSKISDAFGTLNWWWLMGGCDDEMGRPLLAALCKLRRLGFIGQDRIAKFQAAHGLTVDSKIGPITLAAINAA